LVIGSVKLPRFSDRDVPLRVPMMVPMRDPLTPRSSFFCSEMRFSASLHNTSEHDKKPNISNNKEHNCKARGGSNFLVSAMSRCHSPTTLSISIHSSIKSTKSMIRRQWSLPLCLSFFFTLLFFDSFDAVLDFAVRFL
jgi:hypothetical protein